MKVSLTIEEIAEVVAALRMSATEANITANNAQSEGYPSSVASELSARAMDLYLLADKIEEHSRGYQPKTAGTSPSVDPFDTPLPCDEANISNDPIEW
jgi:hypothetical protein